MSFLLSLMFSLQQNQIQEGGTGSAWQRGGGGRDGPNNAYTCE
jgi:hypothetical protein